MKTVVIGGSGHVGTYLVPRLVQQGFEVVSVSRGESEPYTPSKTWTYVEKVRLDRAEEEKNGSFGKKIAALNGDIVIDMINFKLDSAKQIVEALKGHVSHYLYTSSIWAHGSASIIPAPESLPRHPFGDYGIQKAATEAYLHEEHDKNGFPETVVMPGHITGPGWVCINPCGNFDAQVFGKIARGEEIAIPHFGMEAVHHVHADDVAQVFMQSILHRNAALGESFHAVSPNAMTLKGFAEALYQWFGKEPRIRFMPWQEWCDFVKDENFIASTYSHLAHNDNYSIEKGRRLIGYSPRYTTIQAVCECVGRLIENKVISVE